MPRGIPMGRRPCGAAGKGRVMSVARVTEITSESTVSFEDAIQQGIARATKTLRNVKGAWIKEQQVTVDAGKIARYRADMMVTFVLDDED